MIQSLEGMDLADRLREMSGRIKQRIDNVKTEEATKTALVMPFINHVLGYNVFDPAEVVPEFIADVGTKKGEKVDYAIFRNGDPIMLFECKHYGVDLGKEPASQLYRYFSVAKSRFGVLTDGVIYRFYSDIDEQNKMDARPFLEINMLDIEAIDVDELKRFTKNVVRRRPDPEHREGPEVHARDPATARNRMDRPVRSVRAPLRLANLRGRQDQVGDRAVHASDEEGAAPVRGETHHRPAEVGARESTNHEEPASTGTAGTSEEAADTTDDSGIVTTEEEWQEYYAVTAILSPEIEPKRIVIRDAKSLCAILLDNTNRQPVCRLYFNKAQKKIGLLNEQKVEERVAIDTTPDALYAAGLHGPDLDTQVGYGLPIDAGFVGTPRAGVRTSPSTAATTGSATACG